MSDPEERHITIINTLAQLVEPSNYGIQSFSFIIEQCMDGKITSSDGLPCIKCLVFSTPPLDYSRQKTWPGLFRRIELTAAKKPKMLCAPLPLPKKTGVQVFLGVYVYVLCLYVNLLEILLACDVHMVGHAQERLSLGTWKETGREASTINYLLPLVIKSYISSNCHVVSGELNCLKLHLTTTLDLAFTCQLFVYTTPLPLT